MQRWRRSGSVRWPLVVLMVGIGAVVLDGAEVGEEALVAAGSVVTPGSAVAPRTLVAGTPARPLRTLSAAEVAEQRARALDYVRDAREYARTLG